MPKKNTSFQNFSVYALLMVLFFLAGLDQAFAQNRFKVFQPKSFSVSNSKTFEARLEKQKIIPPTLTKIKVWTGSDKEFENFAPEYFIPNTRENLNWKFEWSTRQKGTAKAIYQIALFPFDKTGRNWQTPPGLVKSGSVGKIRTDGTKLIFHLDVAQIIESTTGSKTIALPKKKIPLKKPLVSIRPKKDLKFQKQTGKPTFKKKSPGQLVHNSAPSVPVLTFYIRVVTLNAANKIMGTPSRAAVFEYGKQTQTIVKWHGDPNKVEPPHQEKINNPIFRIKEYRPFHDYLPGWPYRFIITKDVNFMGMKYKKGQKKYWPPSSDSNSVWDKISNAIGSLADFIEDAINAISDKYNSIKNKVLAFAVDLVPWCGDYPPCQTGLAFAMDYGLAAIGLPPSVPNFDDLKRMGKDYLIQYAAEQSNLPVEDAVKVIEKYMEEIDNTASAGGWYKLDTSYQYSDAMLLIEVSNPTGRPTDPAVLTLKQFEKLFKFSGGNGKYKYIPVPSLNPGQTIQVPVMMPPNTMQYTAGASMLQAQWNKLAEKGVLLELFGDYGDNLPNKDQIVVHNSRLKR